NQSRSVGRPVVTAPLVYTGQAELQRDIANLKAGLAGTKGVTGFLPGGGRGRALPHAPNQDYRREQSFLFALADALRTEYRAIIDAGLDLQVDDAFPVRLQPDVAVLGRAQDESPLYQLFERTVEVRVVRHDLVLPPPGIVPVFRQKVGSG